MLEIRKLRAGYSGQVVLDGVDMTLDGGSVTAILGPNGCGKSTLFKALCGILRPLSGEVMLDGEQVLALPQQLRAQRIAYLAQSRQIPDITVERLVLHGRFPYLRYPRRYRSEDIAAAREAMQRMDITDLADAPLNRLSGGQRQKAYIAMALAQATPVILLDEPTTYLDVSHQLQLLREARALAEQGKTVAMVLHDLPHAMGVADRIVLMAGGRVAAQGTPEEVYASGLMDGVFGVRLRRMWAEGAWRYYCEEG